MFSFLFFFFLFIVFFLFLVLIALNARNALCYCRNVMFISPGLELLDMEHFQFICIYIKYHVIFKTLDMICKIYYCASIFAILQTFPRLLLLFWLDFGLSTVNYAYKFNKRGVTGEQGVSIITRASMRIAIIVYCCFIQ